MKLFSVLISLLLFTCTLYSQQKILFDNTKSEQASNADWVIDGDTRFPSPPQSGITGNPFPNPSGDLDTYWSGALSMWGIELVKQGFSLETLPSFGEITYNDGSNAQDLSNYSVFVVCEPNNPFTATEKTAMMNFVSNGGGLFIIADHAGADRDFDGWDALEVWNDFLMNNPVQNNPFGFLFDEESNISAVPTTNTADLVNDPLLHGIAGNVDGLESHAGATMTISITDNATVKAVVYDWSVSNTGTTKVLAAYAKFGNGRVVGLSDSSFAEDETPNDGTTYSGWLEPEDNGGILDKDNGRLITNATIWLAKTDIVPEPANNATNFTVSNTTDHSCTLTWTDAVGGQLPNAYLIKAIVNPESIVDPMDSIYEDNSTLIRNVSYGLEMLTFTDLLPNTTYDFKIFSYSNSGFDIDYLLPTTQMTQGITKVGQDVISDESFTDCGSALWHSYSVTGETDEWTCESGYQDINGYGDEEDEDWLILSFSIDFDAYTEENFTFRTQERYEGPDLEVLYSSNYNGLGDPNAADWTIIPHSFKDVSNGSAFSDWSDNMIDLSSLTGEIYLAFKYNASSLAGSSEHWRVDDLKISGYLDILAPMVSMETTAGCDNSGSVTISSDQLGFQIYYLRDSNGNAIAEWSGESDSHEFIGLSDGVYKGQIKKGNKLSVLSNEIALVNLDNPVAATSVSASQPSICKGSSSTLSFIGGTGDTFNWYKDSCLGEKIGNSSLIVTPMSTTTYYGAWENVCNTSECLNITIIVDELIVADAGSDDSICDSIYQLSANNPDTGIGTWTIGSGGASISDMNLYNTTIDIESFPLILTWEVVNGACTSQDNVELSLLKATHITTQPVEVVDALVGEDVSFSVVANGENLNYQWKFLDLDIPEENSDMYTITSVTTAHMGDYSVLVTGDCGMVESEVSTLSVTTSVLDLDKSVISIFPNPVLRGDYIMIKREDIKDVLEIEIFNYLGQIVFSNNQIKPNEKLDLDLNSGLYFVKISTNKGKVQLSLVVK